MNTAQVLAALCEKAKDVAVASRISEASTRFAEGQTFDESGTVIATLCKKAAYFSMPQKSSKTNSSKNSFTDVESEDSQSPTYSDELNELAKSWSGITPDCLARTVNPAPVVAVRRHSLGEISTTSGFSDFDALSVLAIADSSCTDTSETITIDSLVEAICSDVDILQTLRNFIKSEGTTTKSNENGPNEVVTEFLTVLTAIKNGNHSPTSCHGAPCRRMHRGADNKGNSRKSRHSKKQPFPANERDVDKSLEGNVCQIKAREVPLTSPNSVRQGFSRENATARKVFGGSVDSELLDGSGQSSESFIASDEALLASGWKKALDEKSGRHYYYTSDHAKVTWDYPLSRR